MGSKHSGPMSVPELEFAVSGEDVGSDLMDIGSLSLRSGRCSNGRNRICAYVAWTRIFSNVCKGLLVGSLARLKMDSNRVNVSVNANDCACVGKLDNSLEVGSCDLLVGIRDVRCKTAGVPFSNDGEMVGGVVVPSEAIASAARVSSLTSTSDL